MLWFGVGFGVLILGFGWLVRKRGFTYFHPRGFRSFYSSPTVDKLTPVSRDRFARILAHVPTGDRFDFLQVTHLDDPGGGIGLTREDGEVMLSTSFRPLIEAERLDAFRSQMIAWGYPPVEEHPWNVGMGPDLESVTLEFRTPKDLASLQTMVDRAVTQCDGPAGDSIYVQAAAFDIPRKRYVIRINSQEDPLIQIP